jgi:hypothetical protein
MMTMGTMMDAINRKRIVRMDSGERVGGILPGMCCEWGVSKADYEAGLDAYCAELERLVECIYSEATDDPHRVYTLDNGTIEGSTYVTVNLQEKDATMALLRRFLADARLAVYEYFHPEIDRARQEWIRADLAKNPPIWKFNYDEATGTLVRAPECTAHLQT